MESSVSAVLDIPSDRPSDHSTPGHGSPESRAVTQDGDVVLLVPASSPAAQLAEHAAGDEVTAVMEITDVAPVAVPQRIRGRAWIAGWLTAVRPEERAGYARLIAERNPAGPSADVAWVLLRLEVGEAYVDDLWGAEHVEPDDFAAASPDPLAPHEAELLQHLAASHHEQMNMLCTLLSERGPACAAAEARAVPLSVDRFGMRVRFCDIPVDGDACAGSKGEGDGHGSAVYGYFDVRFEFPEPVADVAQLRSAMRILFESAAG
ncbi:DUF2470 domain-containing protein [Streptomyces albidus (ex Kaewkla and Franco 2022)]|uniref:DUF2470 domain-containing protein n=1 Tax=Streptomyces albidus (ex Kaewkla and Franco 2022) TaxID=722709 RepID=UPI002815BC04|nr:DUF2470 domain-containing protein [Streptomyces albidus (ex Kaewkla and Franco 2022)]